VEYLEKEKAALHSQTPPSPPLANRSPSTASAGAGKLPEMQSQDVLSKSPAPVANTLSQSIALHPMHKQSLGSTVSTFTPAPFHATSSYLSARNQDKVDASRRNLQQALRSGSASQGPTIDTASGMGSSGSLPLYAPPFVAFSSTHTASSTAPYPLMPSTPLLGPGASSVAFSDLSLPVSSPVKQAFPPHQASAASANSLFVPATQLLLERARLLSNRLPAVPPVVPPPSQRVFAQPAWGHATRVAAIAWEEEEEGVSVSHPSLAR